MKLFFWNKDPKTEENIAIAVVEKPGDKILHTTKSSDTAKDSYVQCPSFDEEPWKSRAAALRPTSFIFDLNNMPTEPLPESHPYVRLLNEFLRTVPDECWIDEENEVD